MIFRQILVRIFLTIEVILNLYFLFMYLLFTSKLGLQALLSSSDLFIFLEKCKIKKPHCSVKKTQQNALFRGPAIIRPFRVDLTLFTTHVQTFTLY